MLVQFFHVVTSRTKILTWVEFSWFFSESLTDSSKPYTKIAQAAMAAAVARCEDTTIPFVSPREVHKRCYVLIAGDRGLAGGYNANVFKAVAAHSEGMEACALPLGRKAIERCHRLGFDILTSEYPRVEGMTVGTCYKLAQLLIEGYQEGRFDEVWLVYTSFRSMMSQEVCTDRLLPLEKAETGAQSAPVSTVYELPAEETIARVMPDFLAGRLYSALCDSYASEVAARRTAMDSATKNAGEMIGDLRLKYNRARQGAITQEITEIVAGAEQ